MKGQSKRFVNHKGKIFDLKFKGKKNKPLELESDEERSEDNGRSIGFFDLWRYSEPVEVIATLLSVLLSWCASCGVAGAVLIYGQVTSLFLSRTRLEPPSTASSSLLLYFNGARHVDSTNRTDHMDAVVEDSISFAVASAVIMLVQLVSAAAAVTLANWAARRMINRIRSKLLRAALRQELAFYDTNKTTNFATTLTQDMEKFREGVGEHVAMCSYLFGSVVATSTLAMLFGWQLTLAGLSLVPLSVIVAGLVAKYQTKYSSLEVKEYSRASRCVQEALCALRTVRAYSGEQTELERYASALTPGRKFTTRRGAVAGAGAGAGWLLTYSLNALVLAYGAALSVEDLALPVEERKYTPGVMVTVLFCTFMAAQNVSMCQPHLELFSVARGAARSVYKVLERKSRIDPLSGAGESVKSVRGDIKFQQLYFNYPARSHVKVLRGLTLDVSAGETVALVGASGCGKSTVLQLLQRLYEPQQGNITVDGRDITTLNLHEYRRHIGVVGQEPVLFGGTIRENITMGLDNVTEEQLIKAATVANAHQFIGKLPKGYDTDIGTSGGRLSGGQKQRVAIARAVLRNPAVLLLDEPTSALDPSAERQVQAALDAASVGRTTITVSHRLSTIVNADRIVVMEQGSVLEEGSYDALLGAKGHFWQLLQADMTSESMAAPQPTIPEEMTEEEDLEALEEFQRGFERRSTLRESLTPERCVRGSRRRGSISSARVPHIAVPEVPDQIELEDDTPMPSSSEPPVSTWQLVKLNAPEWRQLALGGAAAFLLGATMPAFALLFSKLYSMFTWSDTSEILYYSRVYSGVFVLTAALCGLAAFLQTLCFNVAGAKLTDRLREMSFAAYLRQEQAWFDRPENSVGALCARLSTDCAAVQGATGTRLGTMLQGISTMAIGVSLSMFYSWKMTLVSLISVPCVMGGIYLEGVVMRRTERTEQKALESASRLATEAVVHISTVHSLSIEESILRRYADALAESSSRNIKTLLVRGFVYGLCLCAPTLGYAVSLTYGGYLIAREDMPLGSAILVSEALIYGAWMLAEALSFAPNFAAARRSGARVVTLLNRQSNVTEPEDSPVADDWIAEGELTLTNVKFSYPSSPTRAILNGVQIKMAAGQTVALVGASGCGKSTIMQLLMRLYDPDEGSVKLDGYDIKTSLKLSQLRHQLGLVQQEPVMFSRTIRENIAYGDNSRYVPIEEIIEKATKANAHSFVQALPQGYETQLGGAGGSQLSGGQKQRLAIARALVRNPRVLLLDEATSALDANTEKTVQAALESASAGRTTVVIAHRLATVKHADVIHVIDRGTIAESGSHEELLKKRGLYYEMWRQQSPSYGDN